MYLGGKGYAVSRKLLRRFLDTRLTLPWNSYDTVIPELDGDGPLTPHPISHRD